MKTQLLRLGFLPDRFAYTFRGGLSAAVALILAWYFGLEHPQWAAMAAIASLQPTRGQLLERSFYRVLGSIVGSIAGVFLLYCFGTSSLMLQIALGVWLGICAAVATVQRGYVSHGVAMAGFTAVMVALLEASAETELHLIAIDRSLTAILGVGVVLMVCWFFTPKASKGLLEQRTRRVITSLFRALVAGMDHLDEGVDEEGKKKMPPSVWTLLDEMALIEQMSDPNGAGSLRSKEAVHTVRNILSAAVPLVTWLPLPPDAAAWGKEQGFQESLSVSADVRKLLLEAANALEHGEGGSKQLFAISMLLQSEGSGRARAFKQIGQALQRINEVSRFSARLLPRFSPLHRDWIGALQAFIRSTVAFVAVAIGGDLLHWDATFMMMSVAVMMSMFNAQDEPQKILSHVAFGQFLGVTGALICFWVFWPMGHSTLDRVLWMIPFIFFGALLWSHKKCLIVGLDYNMALLIILQPNTVHDVSFPVSLIIGAMVVSGPVIALLMYRFVFPLNAMRRAQRALSQMENDLVQLAGHIDAPASRVVLWQAKLSNRILALANWTQGPGKRRQELRNKALSLLQLNRAAFGMQIRLHAQKVPGSLSAAIMVTLKRIAHQHLAWMDSMQRAHDMLDEGDFLREHLHKTLCYKKYLLAQEKEHERKAG